MTAAPSALVPSAIAAGLAALAIYLLLPGRPAKARLKASTQSRSPLVVDPGEESQTSRALTTHAAAAIAGVCAAVFAADIVGPFIAALVGVSTGVAITQMFARLEPAAVRKERLRCVADVPLLAQLLAACMQVGTSVDVALNSAGHALGGPLGERSAACAHRLSLGGATDDTWAPLAEVEGAAVLVRALRRARTDGLAATDVLTQVAVDARTRVRAANLERARRVGVIAAAPLGLCLLPAFVLVGVVPVILAGVAGLDL